MEKIRLQKFIADAGLMSRRAAEDEIGAESVKLAMKSVVPTFYDPEELNRRAEECEEMRTVHA